MNWSKKHIKSYACIMHWYIKGANAMHNEVVCQVAKELPDGCRSDQWNFENGYIIIRWDNGGIK